MVLVAWIGRYEEDTLRHLGFPYGESKLIRMVPIIPITNCYGCEGSSTHQLHLESKRHHAVEDSSTHQATIQPAIETPLPQSPPLQAATVPLSPFSSFSDVFQAETYLISVLASSDVLPPPFSLQILHTPLKFYISRLPHVPPFHHLLSLPHLPHSALTSSSCSPYSSTLTTSAPIPSTPNHHHLSFLFLSFSPPHSPSTFHHPGFPHRAPSSLQSTLLFAPVCALLVLRRVWSGSGHRTMSAMESCRRHGKSRCRRPAHACGLGLPAFSRLAGSGAGVTRSRAIRRWKWDGGSWIAQKFRRG